MTMRIIRHDGSAASTRVILVQSRRKPPGSKMQFTPADFRIGESGIWFYSLMWEQGKDKEPVEFLDDRGIVTENRTGHRKRRSSAHN